MVESTQVRTVSIDLRMDPRTPRNLRALVYGLPALSRLVDAMEGAPFRFYGVSAGNLSIHWTAERAD